jgi:hypothetical protein
VPTFHLSCLSSHNNVQTDQLIAPSLGGGAVPLYIQLKRLEYIGVEKQDILYQGALCLNYALTVIAPVTTNGIAPALSIGPYHTRSPHCQLE